jgi:homoserine kinase
MPPVSVIVPASTANLGSGYDAFGLALALHNTITAGFATRDTWEISCTGEGEENRAVGRDNLVVVAIRRLFDVIGETRGVFVTCENGIPFGRGLGSSSAAIVGGLVAANALTGAALPPAELFRLAADLEGHPDNVAAALFGGFTICWSEAGIPMTTHIDPPRGLAAVVVVSEDRLSTVRARALLPESVPHVDAVFDAGRAGLLVAGLALGRADLIGPGMSDRLHEPYRATAVTDLEAVRRVLLEAGADGAALSGAGPTVIGLVSGVDDADALERAAAVAERASEPLTRCAGRRAPGVIAINREGATVVTD